MIEVNQYMQEITASELKAAKCGRWRGVVLRFVDGEVHHFVCMNTMVFPVMVERLRDRAFRGKGSGSPNRW